MTGLLPHVDVTPLQEALLAEAFHLLLASGRRVTPGLLADSLGVDLAAVEAALGGLDRAGRVRRAADGAVLGSLGLSVTPTPHELLVGDRRRHTWCALDAVAILGALGASGRVRSTDPATGAPIEIRFQDGTPHLDGDDPVLFVAAAGGCTSVVERWCPLVNFFQHADAARAWAAARGVEGSTLRLDEATRKGAAAWRQRIVRRDASGAGRPGGDAADKRS